jgi:hypothetical protein
MIEVGWGKAGGAFREMFANLLMPDAGKEALQWIGEMQRRSASPRNARLMWDAGGSMDRRSCNHFKRRSGSVPRHCRRRRQP